LPTKTAQPLVVGSTPFTWTSTTSFFTGLL
jgi:hypothetical protein